MDAMNTITNGNNKPLQWISTTPSDSVIFLDLNLQIDQTTQKITSSTYQKPLNLHLYLPQSSAHPPSVLKGLIYGNIRRFWIQNSKMSDYRLLVGNFFNHLMNQGHNSKGLHKLFLDASKNLSNNKTTEAENEDSKTKRNFFLVQFHPQ
jgi:hypothetical protein